MAALVNCSFLAILILCFSCSSYANYTGFTVEMIHRDSPKSPFYNPDETWFDRLANAFQRSMVRATSAQPQIIPNNGEYLLNISIGDPPFMILAVVDTGSDLIWTQCKPCKICYEQVAPIFNPENSNTYADVLCGTQYCQEAESAARTSCDMNNKCLYTATYGDGSRSSGNVAAETLTLGSGSGPFVAMSNALIGCGHQNYGTFDSKSEGIVGLGRGPASLVSQLAEGKFSYCLVPFTDTTSVSKLSFGTDAIVSGRGVVSTPLVSKTTDPTFYFLIVEAISVGKTRLENTNTSILPAGETNEPNTIIIDSGTTLTLLPRGLYSKFESEVAKSVPQTRAKDPTGRLSLCYTYNKRLEVPNVTIHFKDADLNLQPMNLFARTSKTLTCLAFVPSNDLAIFGNLAQMGFKVGYDLEKKLVSFKPVDCSKEV